MQLEQFQMDGVQGSMKTWSNFGSWISLLNSETENLDETAKQEIINVSKNAKTNEEKIYLTYEYLQKNMRYVSIQLGIGGFKPLNVNYVHRNKYGDCKALSNYMKSALSTLNISSKYVLIQAGDNAEALDTSISCNPFNHATLMVPNGKDSLWLECTSSTLPAGYQGSFTGNRKALMIDVDNKSTIISTSKSDHKQNLIFNTFYIDFARDTTVRHNSELSGMGIEHHYLHFFNKKPISEISKHLRDKIYNDVKDFETTHYQLTANGPNSKISFTSTFNSEKYVQKSGQRYFIELGIDQPMWSRKESPIGYGYSVSDTYQIKVPDGCKIEKEPKESEMKFSEGEIIYKVINSDGICLVNRSIVIYPHQENKAIDLLKAANKAQTDKVVILCEGRH